MITQQVVYLGSLAKRNEKNAHDEGGKGERKRDNEWRGEKEREREIENERERDFEFSAALTAADMLAAIRWAICRFRLVCSRLSNGLQCRPWR